MSLRAAAPLLLEGIAGWATSVIERLGYGGVALLIALESIFPPIPSEVILPLSGYLAAQGQFWLPAVILAATAGSVAGALVLYGLAAWLGEDRVRGILDRHGKLIHLSGKDLDQADGWFDRHGAKAVMLGRLAPIVRSLISVPAGLRRMPLPRFVLYTSIGSTVWNGALIGIGWILGDRWDQVNRYATFVELGFLVLVVAGIAWAVRRHRASRGGAPHGLA
jgi:membrane protein DedA with SNARE-associated domain